MGNPFKFLNARSLWHNGGATKEQVKAGGIVCGGLLAMTTFFSAAQMMTKNNHRDDPVVVTKSPRTTAERDVWHVKDTRGLVEQETDFISAQNAEDSAYADRNRLPLGEFLSNGQLFVRPHKNGGGWDDKTYVMNYEMK